MNETRAQTLKFGRTARIDPATNAGDLLLDCPMEDLAKHVQSKAVAFPVESSYIESVLPSLPAIFPAQAYRSASPFATGDNATFYRFFEVAVLDWLLQNNTAGAGEHFARYSHLVNGQGDSTRRSDADGALTYAGKPPACPFVNESTEPLQPCRRLWGQAALHCHPNAARPGL